MPAIAALVVGIIAAAGALASSLLPIPFDGIAATSASITQPATASISQNARSPIEPVSDADTFNETGNANGELSSAENQRANIVHLSPQDAAEKLSGRVLGEQAVAVSPAFLSQFSQFLHSFNAYLASPLASSGTAYPRYGGYLPQTGGTTALASPTITGGSILNALTGSFNALSAGTLTLTGTLTGTDATFSGTLTAGTLNVAGLSSSGALIGPYFTATSTTATSTFAGSLDVGGIIAMNGIHVAIASTTLGNYFFGAAGNRTATGGANSGLGLVSLAANTSGLYNSAFGAYALNTNTTGSFNTAIGAAALNRNLTGSNNIAVGYLSLGQNRSATNTVAIGYQAAAGPAPYANQGGTYVGYGAGAYAGTGSDYNTFLGYLAGANVTTGSNNIWIGTATSSTAVANLTTGSQNILIGNNISLPSATANGQLNIGNILFGTDITGTGSTVSSGNVGIGTTTPWGRLSVLAPDNSPALQFVVGSSTATSFFVTAGGNVGIGTTNPSATLGIEGTFDLSNSSLALPTPGSNAQVVQSNQSLTIAPSSNYTSGFPAVYGRQNNFTVSASTTATNLSNLFTYGDFTHMQYLAPAPTSQVVGSVAFATASTSNSVGGLVGQAVGALNYGNGGVTTNAYASQVSIASFFGGTITNAYGYFSALQAALGGTITNGYGLYIASVDATNAWGIYENATAPNYFAGNVGIGTTTPWGRLSVLAPDNSPALQFVVASSSAVSLIVDKSGFVGIGTSTPLHRLSVAGGAAETYVEISNTGAYSSGSLYHNANTGWGMGDGLYVGYGDAAYIWNAENTLLQFATNDIARMTLDATGNLGIGTSSPTAQLHTTGTVRFSNFGAGTLTTDASGNLSVSSDERLKAIDGSFTRGLADIMKLSPISYHWNTLSGLDQTTQYAGFSAQNVQAVIPEAVGSSTSGYLTLQDRPLIAAAVNAIKELSAKLDTLNTAVSGFADRITTRLLAADRITTRTASISTQLCAQKSDGSDVCITADQLAALLSANGGSQSINFVTSPSHEDDTSPSGKLDTLPQATSTATTTPPSSEQAPTAPPESAATSSPPKIGDGPSSESSNPFNLPAPANDNPPPTDNADSGTQPAEQQDAA